MRVCEAVCARVRTCGRLFSGGPADHARGIRPSAGDARQLDMSCPLRPARWIYTRVRAGACPPSRVLRMSPSR